jgi:SAM-dependent methyltransferase
MADRSDDASGRSTNSSQQSITHTFEIPDTPLEFTGERYTPDVADKIQHEHFHRYLAALQLCAGKDVVDLGCGEGYGTALIGTLAASVIGIDASAETIEHARASHGSSSVRFMTADATVTTLPSDSADIVVSFETIEHLEDHDGFMAEVVRLLRANGLLLLSTPDRSRYLRGSDPNPYHLRELNGDELRSLLEHSFAAVQIGGQRSDSASTIDFHSNAGRTSTYFDRRSAESFEEASELRSPLYLIAIAGHGELPDIAPSTLFDGEYLPSLHEDYHRALADVWMEVGSRDRRINELAEAARTSDELLQAIVDELAAVRTELELRESQLTDQGQQLTSLRIDLSEQSRLLSVARAELAAAHGSLSWQITAPLRAGRSQVRELLERSRATVKRPIGVVRASEPYARLRTTPAGIALRRALGRPFGPAAALPLAPPRIIRFADDQTLDPDIRDGAIVSRTASTLGHAGSVRAAERLRDRPLVSILMPCFETPVDLARQTVQSVLSQSYAEWELLIVDDGSTSRELHKYLDELGDLHDRIRVTRQQTNQGISHATNTALSMATGDFVAMLDHDDTLHPDALLEVVRVLNADPDTDAVYTDQAYIEADGEPGEALLKPDWSPVFFCGVMYVGHLLVVRRTVALAVGGFDSHYDNVQDFEFMLRIAEHSSRIAHVPKVLYGWRRAPGSIAADGNAKQNINELQAEAVTNHLTRLGMTAVARPNPRYAHRTQVIPRVEPTEGSMTVLVIGDDPTAATATIDALMQRPGKIIRSVESLQRHNGELHSHLAAIDEDGILMLLESGLVPDGEDWLDELWFYARLPNVAFASGVVHRAEIVEEAGLIVGAEGSLVAAHAGWGVETDGYAGSLSCAREVSAVSSRCTAVGRVALETLGGFDPLFADVESATIALSHHAGHVGLRNVVTPRARFRRVAGESAETDPLDRLLMRELRPANPHRDPFHNPAFASSNGGYRA